MGGNDVINRVIHIRDWKVNVFIDDGGMLEIERITDCLLDMGANRNVVQRALSLVEDANPNEAFTFSNDNESCIYIGWTTSGKEFINSLVHELRHLVDHIAKAYGMNTNGETVGYISGDAAFLLAEDICRMGCPHCGKDTK